jgi:hypothetical protein
MPQMDGANVVVGDSVYDILYGPGTVQQLLPADRFLVVFAAVGGQKSFSYNSTGISPRFPARTLYWHNPVVVVPTKREARWGSLRVAITAIRDALALEI